MSAGSALPGAMGTDLLLSLWNRKTRAFIVTGAMRRGRVHFGDGARTVTCGPEDTSRYALPDTTLRPPIRFHGDCELRFPSAHAGLDAYRMTGRPARWRIAIPAAGIIDGAFTITGLSVTAKTTCRCTHFIELASAGPWNFVTL